MNSIVKFEKVNEDKLDEVIACDNLPTNDCDDIDSSAFNLYNKLIEYKNIPLNNSDSRKVIYNQCSDISYGRFYAKDALGLQSFKREVRKYISSDYYYDIDMKNAHPTLLLRLFEKYEQPIPLFLKEYVNDRNMAIEKYKLTDKLSIFKYMFLANAKPKQKDIRVFHNAIFKNLKPVLEEKDKFGYIMEYVKSKNKKKDPTNIDGSFISLVLQKIENDILMKCCEFLGNSITVLCFDGFLIKKDVYNDDLLVKIEDYVSETLGWDIKFEEKSMETNWKPIVNDSKLEKIKVIESRYNQETAEKLLHECMDNKKSSNHSNIEIFFNYVNKFLCKFTKNQTYGIRMDSNVPFKITNNLVWINSEIGNDIFRFWNKKTKHQNRFSKYVFQVNPVDELPSNIYNLYERPMMIYDENFTLDSLLVEYLFEIVCDSNAEKYEFLCKYLYVLFKYGKTDILLLFLGIKGIGKSFFVETFLKCFLNNENIDDKYVIGLGSLDSLSSEFNGYLETSHLVYIEEAGEDYASNNRLQEKIKNLVTMSDKPIRKMHTDLYQSEDLPNNFIVLTNNFNPIRITKDNRRYFPMEFNDSWRNNNDKFSLLESIIKRDILKIRGYYYNLYKDRIYLQRIMPKTSEIETLTELNKSPFDRYFDDIITKQVCICECDDCLCKIDSYEINDLFEHYKYVCRNVFNVESSYIPRNDTKFKGYMMRNKYVIDRVWCKSDKKMKRCYFKIFNSENVCKCEKCFNV